MIRCSRQITLFCTPINVCALIRYRNILNKKFSEELIAYFLFIRYGAHRKRRLQKFFVATGKCLPNHCLATAGGYTNRPIDSPLTWHRPYKNDSSSNYSILAPIYCRENVSTEPLPRNCKGYTYRHRLMGRTYEVSRWDGLRCHDIHSEFQKDWFRHSKVNKGGYTDTRTGMKSHMFTFIFQHKEGSQIRKMKHRKGWIVNDTVHPSE
jgi:hypothetical protein